MEMSLSHSSKHIKASIVVCPTQTHISCLQRYVFREKQVSSLLAYVFVNLQKKAPAAAPENVSLGPQVREGKRSSTYLSEAANANHTQVNSFSESPASSHPSTTPSSMSPISGSSGHSPHHDVCQQTARYIEAIQRLIFWVIPVAAKRSAESLEA